MKVVNASILCAGERTLWFAIRRCSLTKDIAVLKLEGAANVGKTRCIAVTVLSLPSRIESPSRQQ